MTTRREAAPPAVFSSEVFPDFAAAELAVPDPAAIVGEGPYDVLFQGLAFSFLGFVRGLAGR